MKENSNLLNKILDLTRENDNLSKNANKLNRKVDELSCKLKKDPNNPKPVNKAEAKEPSFPLKLMSLNEKRQSRKKNHAENYSTSHATPRQKEVTDSNPEQITEIIKEAVDSIKDTSEIKINPAPLIKAEIQATPATVPTQQIRSSKLIVCKPKVTKNSLEAKIRELKRPTTPVHDREATQIEENKKVDVWTKLAFERASSTSSAVKNKSPISSPKIKAEPSDLSFVPLIDESAKWKCVTSDEYHSLGIFSIASFEQYLISSSNILKIWDINKKIATAELPNTISKCLCVDPVRKMLIGTTEQNGGIQIWSLPGIEYITTLETGLEHVRTLFLDTNTLFVGGSGSAGALQMWDLNLMSRLYEKEKGTDKDIFSIFHQNSIVYYGGRNHSISRMNSLTLVLNFSLMIK